MIAMRRILREPLVHFLVLGAALFAAFQLAGDRGEATQGKIVITSGKIEHMVTGFSRTWRRPPTAKELDGLVEDYLREEVFYREALALGLDKDDTIVRRRMRQKLEFLAGDATSIVAPTDLELQAWLERHGQVPRRADPRLFADLLRRRGEAAGSGGERAGTTEPRGRRIPGHRVGRSDDVAARHGAYGRG